MATCVDCLPSKSLDVKENKACTEGHRGAKQIGTLDRGDRELFSSALISHLNKQSVSICKYHDEACLLIEKVSDEANPSTPAVLATAQRLLKCSSRRVKSSALLQ